MKTKLLAGLAALTMAAVHPAGAQERDFTIALVPGLTTDAFYITMNRGAQAAADALGVPEQRKVMALIEGLKTANVGVVFISHNLGDIFAVSDRILVLRRGIKAGERRTAETEPDEIVRLMVGA